MSPSRAAFQRNEDLSKRWVTICKQNWFNDVLSAAKATIVDGGVTQEQLVGVRLLENTLLTICDPDEPSIPLPKPKLDHGIDKAIVDVRKLKKTDKPT